MLRRFIAVFSVLAILLCVCVPAFAAPTELNMWDYAEIEVDGLTKIVTISFPDSILETAILDSGYAVKAVNYDNYSVFDLSDLALSGSAFFIAFAPLGSAQNPYIGREYEGNLLNISDLPNGSVLSYSLSVEMSPSGDQTFSTVRSMFNRKEYTRGVLKAYEYYSVDFTDEGDGFWRSQYDYVISDSSQPLWFQHLFSCSTNDLSSVWRISVDYFTITTTIDALQDLVDATGETNRLLDEVNKKLDEITDRPPDPVEPTWGESAGDAEEKEDQIIDQLDPDKVTNDLSDMHLTLVDNLLLYTNAFAAISAIWVVLIDLPFIKIILYCSLLFGLLAAFLGMGLAAGRASDRHSGRSSGKKGK